MDFIVGWSGTENRVISAVEKNAGTGAQGVEKQVRHLGTAGRYPGLGQLDAEADGAAGEHDEQ